MKKGDFIFCYGTLRRGERMDLSRDQNQWGVSFVGETTIEGALYDTLNGYPGVVLNDGNRDVVVGDLFLVNDPSISAILDAYEGYPNLYGREEVETSSGETAWVYTYNPSTEGKQLIASGDWCNQMARAA